MSTILIQSIYNQRILKIPTWRTTRYSSFFSSASLSSSRCEKSEFTSLTEIENRLVVARRERASLLFSPIHRRPTHHHQCDLTKQRVKGSLGLVSLAWRSHNCGTKNKYWLLMTGYLAICCGCVRFVVYVSVAAFCFVRGFVANVIEIHFGWEALAPF